MLTALQEGILLNVSSAVLTALSLSNTEAALQELRLILPPKEAQPGSATLQEQLVCRFWQATLSLLQTQRLSFTIRTLLLTRYMMPLPTGTRILTMAVSL